METVSTCSAEGQSKLLLILLKIVYDLGSRLLQAQTQRTVLYLVLQ